MLCARCNLNFRLGLPTPLYLHLPLPNLAHPSTRFLATTECPIKHAIKLHLALPEVDEFATTLVLGSLSNSTRVLKNAVSEKILEIEAAGMKGDGVNFEDLRPYASGARTKNMWQESGDWNDSMWSCGQSVGLIDDVCSCKVLLERIVKVAHARLSAASRARL